MINFPSSKDLMSFYANMDWFESEADKHSCGRYKNVNYLNTRISQYQILMKRIYRTIMAKDKKPSQTFKWNGYKNISIPESHSSEVDRFVADSENVFFTFNQLITTDYTFKFYFDGKSESYKCTVTCYNPDSSNYGYALSAYAADWFTALAVLIYKHTEIADSDWNSVAVDKLNSYG